MKYTSKEIGAALDDDVEYYFLPADSCGNYNVRVLGITAEPALDEHGEHIDGIHAHDDTGRKHYETLEDFVSTVRLANATARAVLVGSGS